MHHTVGMCIAVAVALGGCDAKKKPDTQATAGQPAAGSGAAPARAPAPVRKPRTWTRPPSPPSLATSSDAWSKAEADKTAAAWDAAAAAYERERAACADDCPDAAYAVVLARKNALLAEPIEPPPGEDPAPLPPRVQALVEALDEYVRLSDASDPDYVGMKFLAANALNKWRQPDALARLEDILRNYRGDPSAEYAANILLDALVRAGRGPEVKALVEELLADTAFLAGKDQLKQTLERLRVAIAEAAAQ